MFVRLAHLGIEGRELLFVATERRVRVALEGVENFRLFAFDVLALLRFLVDLLLLFREFALVLRYCRVALLLREVLHVFVRVREVLDGLRRFLRELGFEGFQLRFPFLVALLGFRFELGTEFCIVLFESASESEVALLLRSRGVHVLRRFRRLRAGRLRLACFLRR